MALAVWLAPIVSASPPSVANFGYPAAGETPLSGSNSSIVVDLGDYRFGALGTPAATVARAGPDQVGFDRQEGYGPWSFDVAADGTVWLLDEVNTRLLVWAPGRADTPRIVSLPYRAAEDFALGPDGMLYVAFKPSSPDSWMVYAIDPTGTVRWTLQQDHTETFNTRLRMGPDGALYKVGALPAGDAQTWTPLTTLSRSPLTADQQRARTTDSQPLADGLTLTMTYPSAHERRFTLATASGATVRTWRITAANSLDLGSSVSTPVLLGNDLVVSLAPNRQATSGFQHEVLTLRLPAVGGIAARVSVDPHLFWGDSVTTLRVGPDGGLYSLRSNPNTGVSIVRYQLTPATATATPTPTPAHVSPTPTTTPSAPPTTASSPPSTTASTSPAGSTGAGAWPGNPWASGLFAGAAILVVAGAGWWRYRRIHR